MPLPKKMTSLDTWTFRRTSTSNILGGTTNEWSPYAWIPPTTHFFQAPSTKAFDYGTSGKKHYLDTFYSFFIKYIIYHSMIGMVMTLEISNMYKIYIFGTLMASEITWHMQFFPKLGLPKSLLLISPILLWYFLASSIVILCFLKKSC